jgi:hypothetical protein
MAVSTTVIRNSGSSVSIDKNLARLLTTQAGAEALAIAAAEESADIMERNISRTQGTGKGYKKNGRVHVASAPGQFPTIDTGELIRSVTVKRVTFRIINLEINVPYSLDLEFGTSKMKARPFVIRSLDEALRTRLPEIFNNFVTKLNNSRVLQRAGRYGMSRARRSAP